jgi:hypothetical protein
MLSLTEATLLPAQLQVAESSFPGSGNIFHSDAVLCVRVRLVKDTPMQLSRLIYNAGNISCSSQNPVNSMNRTCQSAARSFVQLRGWCLQSGLNTCSNPESQLVSLLEAREPAINSEWQAK